MSISSELQGRATALPGQTPAGPRVKTNWPRIAKAGAAIAALSVGGYAVLADQVAIATDNAVVTAYSVSLRTPIDGVIGGPPLRIGEAVPRGATIADVTNNRVDDQRLIDLRERLVGARARLTALEMKQTALGALRADLELRSRAYIASSQARLAGSLVEARNVMAALNDRKDEAAATLSRRAELAQSGSGSTADLDKARADFDVASHQWAAQSGRIQVLDAQLEAIRTGVVSEPGSNDVAYSRQRADEVALRLSDIEEEKATALADIVETQARLLNEQQRVDKLVEAPMIAPNAGIVWKVNASTGERIAAGDTIVQLVDCATAFIIATVPQNRVPEIDIGGQADYRLSGDNLLRHGRVRSVTGDVTKGDHNLAALPFLEKDSIATVRVDMDQPDGECFLGRTARVLIPVGGAHALSNMISRFR